MVIDEFYTPTHSRIMSNAQKNLISNELLQNMRPEKIGYRLMLLREAHGLQKAEISDMLGIERTYWSRFEGGKRPLSDTIAALLAERFGVTLVFLILGNWSTLPLELAEKMREIERSNR